MRQGSFLLRATALLSLGVLVMHELRYRLAFGGHADHALEAHGHSYLSVVAPVVGLLALVAAAHLLQQVARATAEARSQSLTRLWLFAATALLVSFSAQELLEGALSVGHPAGVDAIFGSGGWIALPLALVVGGVVALLLHGAESALEAVAGRVAAVVRPVTPSRTGITAWVLMPASRRSPLATSAAGRAPPFVCV